MKFRRPHKANVDMAGKILTWRENSAASQSKHAWNGPWNALSPPRIFSCRHDNVMTTRDKKGETVVLDVLTMESMKLILCFTVSTITLYVGYYLAFAVRKPKLICKPGSVISLLIKQRCPFVNQLYWPTFWCFGGRAQTMVASVLKSHPLLAYDRELLHTTDGGQIALDWVNSGDPSNHFTILILPGLTGTSYHNYILHFVLQITQKLNCTAVVLNNRGLGGLQLKTPRVCCAADTRDLEYVISRIEKTRPNHPLVVVGISLGGLILTNFLCKMGEQENNGICDMIVDAAVISTPWDLFKTSESLEEPLNHLLFNQHLTKLLQNVLKQHLSSSNFNKFEIPCDINHGLNASTVREFDDRIIAPMSGYKNSNEYYTAASLHIKPLDKINVPLLCLNAADDPFAPEDSIPCKFLCRCPNVAMVLTKHGGHVGFTECLFPCGAGYMEKVIIQYAQALFEQWSTKRI